MATAVKVLDADFSNVKQVESDNVKATEAPKESTTKEPNKMSKSEQKDVSNTKQNVDEQEASSSNEINTTSVSNDDSVNDVSYASEGVQAQTVQQDLPNTGLNTEISPLTSSSILIGLSCMAIVMIRKLNLVSNR